MKTTMFRQGDVLIVRRSRRPAGAAKPIARERGRLVLAHGEATGHAHAIRSPKASLFEVAGRVFLAVDGECVTLDHEEHSSITIPPGDYEVIRQREYAPDAIRTVAD